MTCSTQTHLPPLLVAYESSHQSMRCIAFCASHATSRSDLTQFDAIHFLSSALAYVDVLIRVGRMCENLGGHSQARPCPSLPTSSLFQSVGARRMILHHGVICCCCSPPQSSSVQKLLWALALMILIGPWKY